MKHHRYEGLTVSRMGVVALHLYRQAGEEPGCDPRHLALGIGLKLCPHRVSHASVHGDWLTYPEQLEPRARAYAIYIALARWLLGDAAEMSDVHAMALELALPNIRDRRLDGRTLLSECPNFPRELLYLAVVRLGGSGIFSVPH